MRKMTTEDFIPKSLKIHGDSYSYTKTEYSRTSGKVVITCNTHGEFSQAASEHLQGRGCRKCAVQKLKRLTAKTTEDFLADAEAVHGGRFDYAKVAYENNTTKVVITCRTHGDFVQTPSNHLKGQGCRKCAVSAKVQATKLPMPEFIARATKIHGGRYDYAHLNFNNMHDLVEFICQAHGKFQQSLVSHLANGGCPVCRRQSTSGENWKHMLAKFQEVHGDLYDYSEVVYVNARLTISVGCAKHGKFKQAPHKHSQGTGCPTCSREAREGRGHMPWETTAKRLPEEHVSKYSYAISPGARPTLRAKVEITCPTHGVFNQTLKLHRSGKHPCPECCADSKRITPEEFKLKASIVHRSKYDYSATDYLGSMQHVSVICPDHGEFSQLASTHLNGSGCQRCARAKVSTSEREIQEYIQSLGLGMETQNRRVLEGLEIDILVGDIGIEYNGLYWHSEAHGKAKSYHKDKTELAKSKGVSLLHIFEDEWSLKPDTVKARLAAKLGKSSKTYARKTRVQEVPWSEAKVFYTAHHIQGAGAPGKTLGLYLDEVLMACFTVGARKDVHELLRYASAGTVVGGFSKLLKAYTAKNLHVDRIISYSDLRWGEGKVYGLNGFRRLEDTPLGYFWCRGNQRYSRQKFQKHKLSAILTKFDEDKTEVQNMHDNGYFRIYDCGHAKWEWVRDNG